MTDRLYERISRDTERSGSISKQDARLLKIADDDHVRYVERSVSGAKVAFADRPEGGRLLGDLREGDRVLVTRIDRAARNVRDLLGLVERIEKAGASIVFVDQNIDTAGPMGRFLLTLLGAVAELEAAIVAERLSETRDAFRAEGRFGGGPIPFGYRTVSNPQGRGLVLRPDPELVPTVRDVLARLVAGESQASLAPLVGLGEPGFSRYVRNPILAGIRPGEELVVDPDLAILSLTEWTKLQEHLCRPVKAWSRTDGYGAALACGVCGSRLYLRRDKRNDARSVYACGRRSHAPGSPSVSVTRHLADAFVDAEFLRRFGRRLVLEHVIVSSEGEREEAIAHARLRLDMVRRAQDESDSDDEDERLAVEFRAARAALRTAEAMPATTSRELRPTGRTFAQTWAGADDDERTRLLLELGLWTVVPGRGLPIEEKVLIPDVDPDDYLAGQLD